MRVSIVDDCSRTEHDLHSDPGSQSSRLNEELVNFFFDERNFYYPLSERSDTEIHNLTQILLTLNKIFNSNVQTHTRDLSRGNDTVDWQKPLSFALEEIVTKTPSKPLLKWYQAWK